jgi:hypothetical protein
LWLEDCIKILNIFFMKAEIYDRVSWKFKIILVASIGVLATVIALGEMGII